MAILFLLFISRRTPLILIIKLSSDGLNDAVSRAFILKVLTGYEYIYIVSSLTLDRFPWSCG